MCLFKLYLTSLMAAHTADTWKKNGTVWEAKLFLKLGIQLLPIFRKAWPFFLRTLNIEEGLALSGDTREL